MQIAETFDRQIGAEGARHVFNLTLRNGTQSPTTARLVKSMPASQRRMLKIHMHVAGGTIGVAVDLEVLNAKLWSALHVLLIIHRRGRRIRVFLSDQLLHALFPF